MKKLIILVLVLCSLLILSGCNYGMLDTIYKYDYALIELPGGEVKKVEVDIWYEYEDSDMVQIKATDGTVYYTHSVNVVLVKGEIE